MSERSPGPLTRQQLYDRIRESSKNEYILSEMIRLGYWNEEAGKPSLPAELISKKGELQRELRELLDKQALYKDPEKALKELHKQRKKDALEKREATRRAKNDERYERALNWHQKNQKEITYLGDGFSEGLKGAFTDRKKLEKQQLPVIEDHTALAEMMGISINELRFLSFGRKTSKVSHYQQFLIAKKTGGTRRISAPMPRLKRLQYWVLDNILEKPELHDAAHGFVRERSIVTNAKPHVSQDVVINMDLQDFFPSIDYKRIKGLFCKLGYAEKIATVLAMLCSEPETDIIDMDGETFYVANGERRLPQGAPTSPAISNLLCRRLDKRIAGIANKLGFKYTRYADDLSFSCSQETAHNIQKLFWRLEQIIADEGFVIHPDKTRIMRSNSRQEVTGVVVNEKLSIDRKTLKRFRALLFQIEKDGPIDKSWGEGALFPSIEGYANFVAMVKPEQGMALQKQVMQIKRQYGLQVKPGKILALNNKLMRAKAARGEKPRGSWWQTQMPSAPVKEVTAEEIQQVKQKANQQAKEEQRQTEQENTAAQQARTGRQRAQQSDHHSSPPHQLDTTKIANIMMFAAMVVLILLFVMV